MKFIFLLTFFYLNIAQAYVGPNEITTSKIANSAVTPQKLGFPNIAKSTGSSAVTNSTTTPTDVPGSEATITTVTNKPIKINVTSDIGQSCSIGAATTDSSTTTAYFRLMRSPTAPGNPAYAVAFETELTTSVASAGAHSSSIPCSVLYFQDEPGWADTFTYKWQIYRVNIAGTHTASFNYGVTVLSEM